MKRAPAWLGRLLPVVAVVVLAGCKPTPTDPDAALRSKLAAHREEQIQRLHAYALAGQFPHNTTSPSPLHMFRDAEGRYCAVANLVHQDGRDDLVETTVREHNDLAVHDVHDGPLMAWILESGLTQEELERIQLPAPRMVRVDVQPQPDSPPVPTPDQLVARNRPLRPTVDVLDEDAMKTLVRAHVATVEAELRAHTPESIALAVQRAHTTPDPVRVASR